MVNRVPTTHETSLDMAFIDHFASMAAPVRFPSGWVVEISTHFLGGGRHFGDWPGLPRRWEIADIGFLVLFRQGGRLIRSKVALLQSKRLYPDEQDWDEDSPLDYMTGFGRLFKPDDDWGSVIAPRRFGFTSESCYKALMTGVPQYAAIAQYETQRSVPLYYLLYHPWQIPHAVVLPLTANYRVPVRVMSGAGLFQQVSCAPRWQVAQTVTVRHTANCDDLSLSRLRLNSIMLAGAWSTSWSIWCWNAKPATSPAALMMAD